MKTLLILVAVGVLGCAGLPPASAADDLTNSLQKGLLEEEVNRDLNAAAKAYESAVKQADTQRQAAATAVFRLAETYRKLGRTNDAAAYYRRVIEQFGDQSLLAGFSRTNLEVMIPALVAPKSSASDGVAPGAATPATEGRLLAARLSRIESLKGDPEEQAHAVQAFFPDEGLKRMLWHLPKLRAQAAFARTNQTPQTLPVVSAIGPEGSAALMTLGVDVLPNQSASYLDEQITTQLSRVAERVDFILKSQQARLLILQVEAEPQTAAARAPASMDPAEVASLREEIKLVEQELLAARKKLENGKAEAAEVSRAQKEMLELERKLPENAARDRQIELIQQEQKLVEANLQEVQKKIQVGAAPPLDEIPFRRELLALQRELDTVRRLPAQASVAAAEAAGPQGATSEETDEIQRIRAIIKNSPDLVNARNAAGTQGGTPLHNSAQKGYVAVAEFLLAHGADVNSADSKRQSPLHLAAAAGHKRLCELLLAKGADVNATDHQGFTPFHLAAANGYLAVAEILLGAGAKVNTQANPGGAPSPQPDWSSSPLHSAAEKGFPAVVELLLKNDAAINAKDHGGRPPLVRAIRQNQPATAKLLLEKGAHPNVVDAEGSSPLFWAAIGKQETLVQLLLDHHADPEARISAPEPEGDWTVLFRPVWDGDAAMTKRLLDAGANVNARAASGITPLHGAVIKSRPDMAKLLLDRKPEVNVRDSGGNTPLHYALELGQPAMTNILALLEAGADPNAPGWNGGEEKGWPPLLLASQDANKWPVEVAEALLAHGADVNGKLTNGWTALHRAVQYNRPELVELLIEHQADVNARGSTTPTSQPALGDRKAATSAEKSGSTRGAPTRPLRLPQPGVTLPAAGQFQGFGGMGSPNLSADKNVTPLHVAVAAQNLDLARYLLEHGADVNAGDAEGHTPLHFAINRRDLELIRLVLDAKADPNAPDSAGKTPLNWVADSSVYPPMGMQQVNRGMVMQAQRPEIETLLRERGAKDAPAAGPAAASPEIKASPPGPPKAGAVRVLGELKRPGTVSVGTGPRKDIIDAIAESGGLTENAKAEIEFTRDGQTQKFLWDQLKAEADPSKKIWLQPGDIIEVKRRVF